MLAVLKREVGRLSEGDELGDLARPAWHWPTASMPTWCASGSPSTAPVSTARPAWHCCRCTCARPRRCLGRAQRLDAHPRLQSRLQPLVDRRAIEAVGRDRLRGRLALSNPFNGHQSDSFQRLMVKRPPVSFHNQADRHGRERFPPLVDLFTDRGVSLPLKAGASPTSSTIDCGITFCAAQRTRPRRGYTLLEQPAATEVPPRAIWVSRGSPEFRIDCQSIPARIFIAFDPPVLPAAWIVPTPSADQMTSGWRCSSPASGC